MKLLRPHLLCLGLMMKVVPPCMLTTHLAFWLVSRASEGQTLTATFRGNSHGSRYSHLPQLSSWPQIRGAISVLAATSPRKGSPILCLGPATPVGAGKPSVRWGSQSGSAQCKETNFLGSMRSGVVQDCPHPSLVPGCDSNSGASGTPARAAQTLLYFKM